MKKLFFTPLLALILVSLMPDKKKIKIFMAGDSTMAIKDPKAYPETGWGMPFVYFWDSTVTIVNRAKNGRSTKTFLSEGLWKSISDEAKEGDYVFIQFGHNDESPDKKERYATPDTFKMLLTKFIRETREKKSIPVLLTPVSRRKFKDGHVIPTHEQYSALTREVAVAEKVLFIDLDTKSMALYEQWGEAYSKKLFMQLDTLEHPNYPDGRIDNTHFTELGARLIAEIVLKEIRTIVPELAERIYVPVKK